MNATILDSTWFPNWTSSQATPFTLGPSVRIVWIRFDLIWFDYYSFLVRRQRRCRTVRCLWTRSRPAPRRNRASANDAPASAKRRRRRPKPRPRTRPRPLHPLPPPPPSPRHRRRRRRRKPPASDRRRPPPPPPPRRRRRRRPSRRPPSSPCSRCVSLLFRSASSFGCFFLNAPTWVHIAESPISDILIGSIGFV